MRLVAEAGKLVQDLMCLSQGCMQREPTFRDQLMWLCVKKDLYGYTIIFQKNNKRMMHCLATRGQFELQTY